MAREVDAHTPAKVSPSRCRLEHWCSGAQSKRAEKQIDWSPFLEFETFGELH